MGLTQNKTKGVSEESSQKQPHLMGLPEELIDLIARGLFPSTLSALALTCKKAKRIATPILHVSKLLHHVARGEQDEAKAMIEQNPALLTQKGTVTDYSNRTFENISAFQYALWALDRHMWDMIVNTCPEEYKQQLTEQLRELEELPETGLSGHGKHYDFTPLLTALDNYVQAYDEEMANGNVNWDRLDKLWIQGVGRAQYLVPVHVANEYCRPDRPFYPTPAFGEDRLPRAMKDIFDKFWFSDSLGSDFAFCRAAGAQCRITLLEAAVWAGRDLVAVTALMQTRTGEYNVIKDRMLMPAAVPRPV